MSPVEVDAGVRSRSNPTRKRKRSAAIIGDPASKKGDSPLVVRLIPYRNGCLHPHEIRPNRDPRHVTLSFNCVCLDDSISIDWARRALTSFNKKRRAKNEPEFELVEALQCIQFPGFQAIYHSNFVARPINGSEGEHELFFAEVKRESKVCRGGATRNYFICSFCCILEPSPDSRMEARPSGCSSCDRHPGCVKHPLSMNGFLT